MQILVIALTLPKDYRESLQGRNFDTQGQHCENVEKGRYFPFLNEATNFQQEDRVLCRITTNHTVSLYARAPPGIVCHWEARLSLPIFKSRHSVRSLQPYPYFTLQHSSRSLTSETPSNIIFPHPQSLLLIIQLSLRTLNHHQLDRTLQVSILLIPFIRKPNLNSILSSPRKLPHKPPLTSLQYR